MTEVAYELASLLPGGWGGSATPPVSSIYKKNEVSRTSASSSVNTFGFLVAAEMRPLHTGQSSCLATHSRMHLLQKMCLHCETNASFELGVPRQMAHIEVSSDMCCDVRGGGGGRGEVWVGAD